MKPTAIAFARLTKIDEGKRLVYGRAVQEVPDRAGEIFDYATSKPLFEAWSRGQSQASLGKSAGNVRAMHKDVAAGVLVPEGGITFHDDERAIDVVAKIVDEAEWQKCLAGVYTGYSIGGRYAKKWEDTELKKTRYTGEPSEISLVDRPCIPTATFFEVQKSDGTLEKRDFAKPTMLEIVRRDGVKLEKQVDSRDVPAAGEEFEIDGLRYAVAKVEGSVVHVDEVFEITGSPSELGAFAKLLNGKKLTISAATSMIEAALAAAPKEPTKEAISAKATELAKAEPTISAEDAMRKAEEILRKEAGCDDDSDEPDFKKNLGEAELAAYEKMAPEDRRKFRRAMKSAAPAKLQKFGSVAFADEEGRKYPIDSAAQVAAALHYIALPKVAKTYSAEKLAKVKARIEKAAEEMGIRILDASKLGKADSKALQKGLLECGQFAYLLDSLCKVAESAEMEANYEGDGSVICDRIYAELAKLGDILADMVREEIGEATADPYALALSEGVKGLQKAVAGRWKPVVSGELVATPADAGEMKKVVDAAVGPLKKLLEEAGAKIEKLEKQPRPATITVRAIGKEEDGNGAALTEAQRLAATVQPVLKQDGTVDEVATATKMVLAKGGSRIELRKPS